MARHYARDVVPVLHPHRIEQPVATLVGDDDRVRGGRDVENAADHAARTAVQADEGSDRSQEDDYDGVAEAGQHELHLRLLLTWCLKVSRGGFSGKRARPGGAA